MTKLTKDQRREPGFGDTSEDMVDIKEYKALLMEAVTDTQYMLIHAAKTSQSEIGADTLKKLISARRQLENEQELSEEQEAEFWIAYQDLWELVRPSTAESIKANLLVESTLMSRLLKHFPALSSWFGKGTTSKSRRTVSKYIVFTVFVLFLLLSFQIYWVVGNQLITEMGALSQREDFLITQLAETASTPGAGSDSNPTRASLEEDIKALESKDERYAAILWLWSKPWSGYIEVIRKEHDPKFASRFLELDQQITAIENKIKDDPKGMKEAGVNAQQKDLETKLSEAQALVLKPGVGDDVVELTAIRDNIQAQINNLSTISVLDSELIKLAAEEEALNVKIPSLEEQKLANEDSIITLTADKNTMQESINSLTAKRDPLPQTIKDLEMTKTNIEDLLKSYLPTVPATPTPNPMPTPQGLPIEEIALLPEDLQKDLKEKPISTQLDILDKYKQDTEIQLFYLNKNQQDIDIQLAQLNVDVVNIQAQIDNLGQQVVTLAADINESKGKLTTTQSSINTKRDEKKGLEDKIEEFQGTVDSAEAQAIFNKRETDLDNLKLTIYNLSLEEQEYLDRTDSRPAQLAGQFVLNILQSYFLPILYGLLGASTSVLRSLSRQIRDVTFSEKTGIQHLLSISLGALAGIVVGWFSFLVDAGSTSFLGSVSPLAIAFLVGYNIDPFFSRMDLIMKRENEVPKKETTKKV